MQTNVLAVACFSEWSRGSSGRAEGVWYSGIGCPARDIIANTSSGTTSPTAKSTARTARRQSLESSPECAVRSAISYDNRPPHQTRNPYSRTHLTTTHSSPLSRGKNLPSPPDYHACHPPIYSLQHPAQWSLKRHHHHRSTLSLQRPTSSTSPTLAHHNAIPSRRNTY